jgi:hypothetical protein
VLAWIDIVARRWSEDLGGLDPAVAAVRAATRPTSDAVTPAAAAAAPVM